MLKGPSKKFIFAALSLGTCGKLWSAEHMARNRKIIIWHTKRKHKHTYIYANPQTNTLEHSYKYAHTYIHPKTQVIHTSPPGKSPVRHCAFGL